MPRLMSLIMFTVLTSTGFAETIQENSEFFMVGTIASVEAKEKDVAVIRAQMTGTTFTVAEGEVLGPGRTEVVETIETERIVIRNGQDRSAIVRDPFPPSQDDNTVEAFSFPTDIYPEDRFPPDLSTQGIDAFSDSPHIDPDIPWQDPLDEVPLDEAPTYIPPH